MKRTILVSFFALMVFLTACDNSTSSQSVESAVPPKGIQNVSWLRNKLPAETFAYLRIPTIWQMFFEEKADVLYSVQSNQNHVQQIDSFKKGLLDSYLKLLPSDMRPLVETIIQNMVSPFEVAFVKSADGKPVPNTLIATTLRNTSLSQLDILLKLWKNKSGGQIQIIDDFDNEGFGKLAISMTPTYIYFNEKDGRLLLFAGLSSSKDELKSILSQQKYADDLKPILNFENSVDAAGKNLELWVNFKSLIHNNKNFIPPHVKPIVSKFALEQMEYLWVGTSAIGGKSRFIVRLQMPDEGFRQFLPRVDSELDIHTAGTPRSVWQIAVPNEEQLKQIYELILSMNEAESVEIRKVVDEKIQQVNEYLGVSLSEIMNTYGQKLLVITDESGTWFASKINDMNAHKLIVEKVSKAFKTESATKELAGVPINQTRFSIDEFINHIFPSEKDKSEIEKLLNVKQYGYYLTEGDYFIQAYNPQVLADRANYSNQLKLQDWLKNKQHTDFTNSIIAYSKEVNDAPRDIYYGYLNVLQYLASYSHTELDLFALPTAHQLNLPKSGRFGFALDSSKEALMFSLNYEYSPIEQLSSNGGMLMIAGVGILAAYTIPSYRDYTVRAKVTDKIYSVNEEKYLIEDSYIENGTFPNTESISDRFDQSDELVYNPKNGEITIYIGDDIPALSGKYIKITPHASDDGYIYWDCDGSTVDKRFYEYSCF